MLLNKKFDKLPDNIITNLIYYEIIVPDCENEFEEIILQKKKHFEDSKNQCISVIANQQVAPILNKSIKKRVILPIRSPEELYQFFSSEENFKNLTLELVITNYFKNLIDHLPFNIKDIIKKVVIELSRSNIDDFILFSKELNSSNHYLKKAEFIFVVKEEISAVKLNELFENSSKYRLIFDFAFNFNSYSKILNLSSVEFYEEKNNALAKIPSKKKDESQLLSNILNYSYQSSFNTIALNNFNEFSLNDECKNCALFPICGGNLSDKETPDCPPFKEILSDILVERYKL
jgi:radical SAM protein with 4Fe4S-binding SPASM domain